MMRIDDPAPGAGVETPPATGEADAQASGAIKAHPRRLALFETPVTVARLENAEQLAADLKSVIRARMSADMGIKRSNHRGWHSDTEMISWGGSPARRLANLAVALCQQISAVDGRQAKDLAWSVTMWANVSPPGALNHLHVHPGHLWAAVFYVDTGEEPGGPDVEGRVYFEDPRFPMTMVYPGAIRMVGGDGKAQDSNVELKTQANDLIVFPAWLRHGVREYKGERERISIAMNIGARAAPPQQSVSAPDH